MSRSRLLHVYFSLAFLILAEAMIKRHPTRQQLNQSLNEPDWWEQEYERVNANGEVRPAHLNPATVSEKADKVISVIPDNRIISGKDVNKGEIPYQANMFLRGRHHCGGSVYNTKTIITAAHCFYGYSNKKLSDEVIKSFVFVAGDHDNTVKEGTEQSSYPERVILHPRYNHWEGYNDIAIVRLVKPFVYNKYVQPLPIDYVPVVAEHVKWAWISGWGYTKKRLSHDTNFDSAYKPKILKKALVEVFPRQECHDIYNYDHYHSNYLRRLENGDICAGERTSRGQTAAKDACQGDSGGPLACINPKKHNRRFLCGIVSTGIGCGLPGLPGLYTRVADFQDWIISVAGYADKRTF